MECSIALRQLVNKKTSRECEYLRYEFLGQMKTAHKYHYEYERTLQKVISGTVIARNRTPNVSLLRSFLLKRPEAF